MPMSSLKVKPALFFGDTDDIVPGQAANDPSMRILVVEDDSLVLRLYSDVLLRSGYTVDTAEDGDEGWKALYAAQGDHRSYDLLITDNSMPKVTGIELITKLRANGMNLPVILATGLAPANIDHLRLAAILTKPFSTSTLLQIVEEIREGSVRTASNERQA